MVNRRIKPFEVDFEVDVSDKDCELDTISLTQREMKQDWAGRETLHEKIMLMDDLDRFTIISKIKEKERNQVEEWQINYDVDISNDEEDVQALKLEQNEEDKDVAKKKAEALATLENAILVTEPFSVDKYPDTETKNIVG